MVLELDLPKVWEGGETTVERDSEELRGTWQRMEGHVAGMGGSAKLVRLMPSASPSHMPFALATSHPLIFSQGCGATRTPSAGSVICIQRDCSLHLTEPLEVGL